MFNSNNQGYTPAIQEKGIKAWFKKREIMKQNLRNQAAKMITDKLAENENKFVEILDSINFKQSEIPKDILNRKKDENQSCGDLEHFAKGLKTYILTKSASSIITCDIRKIDLQLMTLLLLYKQAIENGDVNAAYAARYALIKGFYEIRGKIPQQQPNLYKHYVESYSKYLEDWVKCLGFALLVDQNDRNVKILEADYNKKADDRKKIIEETLNTMKNDPQKASALVYIQEHDSPSERAKWDSTMVKIHGELVDATLDLQVLGLVQYKFLHSKDIASENRAKFEMLKVKLNDLPIVTDPNMMNDWNDQMEEMFKAFARQEAEIEETLTALDNYSDRIEELYQSKGSKMMAERASAQAGMLIDEARKLQQQRLGVVEGPGNQSEDITKKCGILSDDEEKEVLRKIEEDKAKKIQEAQNALVNADENLQAFAQGEYDKITEDEGETLNN